MILQFLVSVVFICDLGVMVSWWITTRGQWVRWLAGRAIMALLAAVALLSGLGATSRVLGNYPGKLAVYAGAYLLLIAAILWLWHSVFKLQRIGRERDKMREVGAAHGVEDS